MHPELTHSKTCIGGLTCFTDVDGDSDLLGYHGGGPHANFEILAPNPAKPGKMMVIKNIHIYLEH